MNRLLGVTEHLTWLLDQSWTFNFILIGRVRGAIAIPQLTDALACVQRRHPLLAVKIVAENGQPPRFASEGVPNIPLQVFKRQADDHWCREAEAEHSLPFSVSTGPLVRVVLLEGENISELIIVCHHSLGDGLSAVYLLRDILQEMSAPGSRSGILSELPSWTEIILSEASINNKAIISNAPPQKEAASNAIVELNCIRDKEALQGSQRSSILHWCLCAEETAVLVERCRENQTTVHSAICAAFLLSIAEEMNYPEDAVHKCVSPCSIRNYLVPAIGEDFGLYISRLFTAHVLKPTTSFWGLAQDVKRQINELTAPDKIFQSIRPTKAFLSTNPAPQVVYQKTAEQGDLCITNLGRLNIPQEFGSLYLEAIYGPVIHYSENAKIVGVATLGGKMFFNLTFSESVLSRSQAEKIQIQAMRKISEALEIEEIIEQ